MEVSLWKHKLTNNILKDKKKEGLCGPGAREENLSVPEQRLSDVFQNTLEDLGDAEAWEGNHKFSLIINMRLEEAKVNVIPHSTV